MPIFPIPITVVRVPNRAAAAMLHSFVDGGRLAGRRPPRGVDPAYVSIWIRETVKPDCDPDDMMRVGDILRFYERNDVIDHFRSFLRRNESDEQSFTRALYVLQAIGEVGSPDEANFAARYFEEVLLPRPTALDSFNLVLETAEALALAVDFAAVGRRLQAALEAAGKVPNREGPAGLPWRKYSDYSNNNYPNAALIVEAKRRLFRADPAQRLQELLLIYLGKSSLSSFSMEVWAGRLIRKYPDKAETHTVVIDAFAQVIDGALKSQMPKFEKDFLIHRAAQAIIYLQGNLSDSHGAVYRAIVTSMENFLWDGQV